MPALDMPLEQLKQYQGTNPRPADFDAYWDTALAEMKSQDSHLEVIPADIKLPNTDCFDLYFTGVRGARIHAKYLRPAVFTKPMPAILQFHGYTGDSGDWSEKLSYVHAGYAVFALDVRGQSGLSQDVGGVSGITWQGHIIRGLEDGPHDLFFRHVFLDTAQLAGLVMAMPEIDAHHVATTGGSQGGALALVCAALEPRVWRTAAMHPFLSDYKRVWDMDLAAHAYTDIPFYFRRKDPLHERETEIFTRLGYIDIQFLAPRIHAEVLMGATLRDDVCPPSTQFAAYNKIQSAKNILVYPDFSHEAPPGFHDLFFQFLTKGEEE